MRVGTIRAIQSRMNETKRGRPNTHLTETSVAIRMPLALAAQVKTWAARNALSASEVFRRGARLLMERGNK